MNELEPTPVLSKRRQQREDSHNKILASATAQFRDNGYNATGIADVMKDAGLTNGAFYSHFDSKEALLKKVLSNACEQIRPFWVEGIEADKPLDRVAAMIDLYISLEHRDNPADGCPLPTLGNEIARQNETVRNHFEAEIGATVELLESELALAGVEGAKPLAWALVSLSAGSIMLSRTVADKKLADMILDASRSLAQQQLDAVNA